MTPDQSARQEWLDKGKIIVLNGFPGTGKFTIAKEMKSYFPEDIVRLIDNHILIDPAQAIYPDRSVVHHELRRKIRAPIFSAIRDIAEQGKTILMTACLAENDADATTFKEHISMVHDTPIPLYWINLRCDQSTLEERLVSTERQQGLKSKLVDISTLRQMMKHELLNPHLGDNEPALLIVNTVDVSGTLEESVYKLLHILQDSSYLRR